MCTLMLKIWTVLGCFILLMQVSHAGFSRGILKQEQGVEGLTAFRLFSI